MVDFVDENLKAVITNMLKVLLEIVSAELKGSIVTVLVENSNNKIQFFLKRIKWKFRS